jgi:hypothetical protein
MNAIVIITGIIGTIAVLQLVVTAINILQKGGPYRGQSVDEILGRPASTAAPEDILRMSKPEVMQLFYAAPAPDFGAMKGEYRARNIPVGIQGISVQIYSDHFFGPGSWEGKAFLPGENGRGSGYNMFRKGDRVFRTRKMDTFRGKSNIDGRQSFHIDYRPYNGGTVRSMRDELRKINDTLYIGMGYMALGGGSINPGPFIVYGKPGPWVGIDQDMN